MLLFWDTEIDVDNVLLDEEWHKNKYKDILIYDISYKTLMIAKPLRISSMK